MASKTYLQYSIRKCQNFHSCFSCGEYLQVPIAHPRTFGFFPPKAKQRKCWTQHPLPITVCTHTAITPDSSLQTSRACPAAALIWASIRKFRHIMNKDNKIISYLTNLLLSFLLRVIKVYIILLGQDVGSSLVALIIFWLNLWHNFFFLKNLAKQKKKKKFAKVAQVLWLWFSKINSEDFSPSLFFQRRWGINYKKWQQALEVTTSNNKLQTTK